MVKKQIQPHDFLNGGPKLQYSIDFGADTTSDTFLWTTNTYTNIGDTNITFGDYNTTVLGHGDNNMTPRLGDVRWNIEGNFLEFYDGISWSSINT